MRRYLASGRDCDTWLRAGVEIGNNKPTKQGRHNHVKEVGAQAPMSGIKSENSPSAQLREWILWITRKRSQVSRKNKKL